MNSRFKINSEIKLGISFIISAFFCLFTWLHFGVQFSGMDDYSLMAFMSGELTGQTEIFLYVQNIIYTGLVSQLYKLLPSIPWFTVVFLSGIFLAVMALVKSLLKSAHSLWQAGFSIFLSGVIYCGAVMYAASLLQFTSVSAICGMGAIALLLSLSKDDVSWERVFDVILICILVFMGITIRKDTGYFVFAVFAATCLYKLIEKKVNTRIILKLLSGVTVFFIISLVLQQGYLSKDDWAQYKTYNDARAGILDYPCIVYENDTDFFESIGWDEELVNLAEGNWYSMDDSIEVSDMVAIRQKSDEFFADNGLSLFEQIIKVTDIGFTYRYLGFWGLVLLITVAGTLISKNKGIEILGAVAYYLGAIALLLFLGVVGRMTFALMNSIFILAMPPSLMLLNRILSDEKGKVVFKILGVLFILILSYKMVLTGRGLCQRINHYEDEIALKNIVDDYTFEHIDNLYIYDTNLPMMGTAFDTPTGRDRYNLVFWGGTFYESPMYHRQLAKCGYDRITSEYWFNDDIYYMTKDEPNVAFVEFMSKHYTGCEISLIDDQECFKVYKLTR